MLLALGILTLTLATPADPVPVTGRVELVGRAPEAQHWELDEFMRPFHDADVFVDELWLVAERGGLANVVVALHALDVEPPPVAAPLPEAAYEKIGPRYVPRVLVVTPGTEVVLRNVDSPCNGFSGRGRRGSQFNTMVGKGTEKKVTLKHRDVVPVSCDVREMMRGAILVVDTPWFAISDAGGRFSIPNVPAGRYRLRIWHEGLGWLKAGVPTEIEVSGGQHTALELRLPSPREEDDEDEEGRNDR